MVNEKVERVEKDQDNNLFLITTTKENIYKNRKARAKYLIITNGYSGIQYQT